MVTFLLALMWGMFVVFGPISALPFWEGAAISLLGGLAIALFVKN